MMFFCEVILFDENLLLVNEVREIVEIELNINDDLIMYLSNGGEPSPDGGGSPFSVVSRRMLTINPVNIRICIY